MEQLGLKTLQIVMKYARLAPASPTSFSIE